MKTARTSALGWVLGLLGLLVVVASGKIVFPGLEMLLGIETIVGNENVVYQPDGSYLFTNPGAMMRWIGCVAMVGVATCSIGVWLLLKARGSERADSASGNQPPR